MLHFEDYINSKNINLLNYNNLNSKFIRIKNNSAGLLNCVLKPRIGELESMDLLLYIWDQIYGTIAYFVIDICPCRALINWLTPS